VVPRSILQVLSSQISQIHKTSIADSLHKIEIFHQSSFLLSIKTRPLLCAHHQEDGAEVIQLRFKLHSMARTIQKIISHSITTTL